MKYHWIEDIRDFQSISQKWDQVLLASNSENPFLLSDFILTWWKYYHLGNYLRILVIDDGDELIGGIPLYLRKESWKKGFLKSLYYIGDGAANYTEPLFPLSKNFWPIFLEALEYRNDWDLLHLFNVRDQNNLVREFNPELLSSKMSTHLIQDHLNWAIDLSKGTQDYFNKMPERARRYLKSKRKFVLENYGPLSLRKISGKEDVEFFFKQYVDFSRSSFSARDMRSTFENEKHSLFFKDFLIGMDQHRWLDAHVLFAGNVLLAISFVFKIKQGFNWMLTSFNYKYKDVKPGYLLIEELIKEIVRREDSYYNMYGHSKFYKTQWCNQTAPLYRIKIFKKNIYNTSLNWAEETLRSSSYAMSILRDIRALKHRIIN